MDEKKKDANAEKNEESQEQIFNVLMFGSRRAGKSSILASMIDQFEAVKVESGISLEADEATMLLLEKKRGGLRDIFMKKKIGERWLIDEEPTSSSYSYNFHMSVRDSEKKYVISFTDIPGEWLMECDNQNEIVKKLEESQVIMIAIDTPHLVAENGAYSDAFNIADQVDRLFRLAPADKDTPKQILFVPVKCEKYYHEGRMDTVTQQIEIQYENLLTSFKTGKKKDMYMVAITPILTLGGVEFDDFLRDEEGDVDLITNSSIPSLYLRPKAAYYKLYSKDPSFQPKYCEQPVLYLLDFILQGADFVKKSEKAKEDGKEKKPSWFHKAVIAVEIVMYFISPVAALFIEVCRQVAEDKILIENARQAVKAIKTEGDGYKVLQNPFQDKGVLV